MAIIGLERKKMHRQLTASACNLCCHMSQLNENVEKTGKQTITGKFMKFKLVLLTTKNLF
jgi:hypothetical protein